VVCKAWGALPWDLLFLCLKNMGINDVTSRSVLQSLLITVSMNLAAKNQSTQMKLLHLPVQILV
jgi:hypothetical protein